MPIVTNQTTFDALFAASRDPRLAALQNPKTPEGLPDVGGTYRQAVALHDLGLSINEGVDIYGMSPYLFMRWLLSNGYVWHEAMFQQQPVNLYDYRDATKAWPASIKISLDDADYPPLVQPVSPVDRTSPIGVTMGDGRYGVTNSFWRNGSPAFKEGAASTPYVTPDNQTLYAHFGSSTFVNMPWWETATAKAARIAAGG